MRDLLLGCDMDRTLLPNGPHPESPAARPLLRALRALPGLHLAYLTGRSRELIEEAVERWELPWPDLAAADVGTTIYRCRGGGWEELEDWRREIAPDWAGAGWADLRDLLADLPHLELQEPERQKRFKLSYYAPPDLEPGWPAEMQRRLDARGLHARVIVSRDEAPARTLLDVIPASATKHHAAHWMLRHLGLSPERVVVAGDSGNDLPLLAGDLPAVLVANARPEVREEALSRARAEGTEGRLYLARGGFLGLNGNYSAGVLEGLAHFLPETRTWLEGALQAR